ncbi:MAG: RNA polymerase sigma factor, partial [Chitinophagaceae bacterium]
NYRRRSKQNTIFDSTPNDYFLDHNQSAVPNSAEANIGMKNVMKALHDLPSIFKQPFMLYFEGYKYHEIADMLNEPLGTIKSRIHFARRLLKDQITKF